jgi:hypothetical protein
MIVGVSSDGPLPADPNSFSCVQGEEALTEAERDLKELKESLKDTQPMGALVDRCKTLDQVSWLLFQVQRKSCGLEGLSVLSQPSMESAEKRCDVCAHLDRRVVGNECL